MINGFKIQVSSDELRTRMRERVTHHVAKAEHYEAQVANLVAGGDRDTGHSVDPVGALRQRAQEHRSKTQLFKFMEEHIIPDETYQLDESDLARLEIIDRGRW